MSFFWEVMDFDSTAAFVAALFGISFSHFLISRSKVTIKAHPSCELNQFIAYDVASEAFADVFSHSTVIWYVIPFPFYSVQFPTSSIHKILRQNVP